MGPTSSSEESGVARIAAIPWGPPVGCPWSLGRSASWNQDQVLRNHRVGSTSSFAALGPRLVIWILISRSWGEALAYSTCTSK